MKAVSCVELVDRLVYELGSRELPTGIVDERTFEQLFVEPVCTEILRPQLCVATHPWGDKSKEKCWRESKAWAAVTAWGLKHTFDVVARNDDTTWRMAVEVKLSKMRGGSKPTGDFQRMMGQCILARLRHDAVIAVFGYSGDLAGADNDDEYFKKLRVEYNIWVATRKVELPPS